ncbi:hypothetical protein [Paenibacillus kandeliae]|uniref:hypothetical protein n=1 Tax=Paenibacillus kandeliae TaxID=3231269 RepID=UPI00345A1B15
MAFINFKPTVKAVNLKSDGDIEIKLLVPGHEMRGRIEMLHEMIGEKVEAEFASTVVSYNVQINARTSKPITQYRVDDTGVVHEVTPEEGEQVEMELGLPPEKLKIEDKSKSIDLQVIVDFILESLAPEYDDLQYDFYTIHDRLSKGETYSRIATELGVSSGKLAEMVEEYRRRVAPMAQKWNEWREGNEPSIPVVEAQSEPEQVEADPEQEVASDDQPADATGTTNLQDELPDWIQQSMQDEQNEQNNSQSNDNAIPDATDIKLSEIDREELEQFILTHKPMYPDIEFNYPDLLEKRHTGKSWLDIAKELQVNSSKLKNSWVLYKKRAARQMIDNNGAA